MAHASLEAVPESMGEDCLHVLAIAVVMSNNRCLANWATVVCQKEELPTHWISLYLSYSQCPPSARAAESCS